MSERFFIESYGIWDNEKGNEQLTWSELCNVLNELNNENEQLKEKIKALEDANVGLVETIAHFDIEEVMR